VWKKRKKGEKQEKEKERNEIVVKCLRSNIEHVLDTFFFL